MPKRQIVGKVVSNKMEKTGICSVTSDKPNRLYGKLTKSTKKYKFHDDDNACNIGDTVEIEESKPYSKDKTWRLVRILVKAGE